MVCLLFRGAGIHGEAELSWAATAVTLLNSFSRVDTVGGVRVVPTEDLRCSRNQECLGGGKMT